MIASVFVAGNVIMSIAGVLGVADTLPVIDAPLKLTLLGVPVVGPVTEAFVMASIWPVIGTYPADVMSKSKVKPAFQLAFPLGGAMFRPPTIV
jgi:hypothetical protein